MTEQNPLLTIKELSQVTGVSVKIIRTRLDPEGLEQCKVRWGTKRFLYAREKAFQFLRHRGFPL